MGDATATDAAPVTTTPREDAAAYMLNHNVDGLLETVLADLVTNTPSDPFAVVSSKVYFPSAQLLAVPWPAGDISSMELGALTTLSFDMMPHGDDKLCLLVYSMFDSLGLVMALHLDKQALQRWILAVRANYSTTIPFHTWRHAFNVTQTMYAYLVDFDMRRFFSHVEQFALMFAAVCHDVQHPGFNNAFQIATGTNLARRYNDRSVLENHHAATAFAIVEEVSGCNILATLRGDGTEDAKAPYRSFRRLAVHCILATDVATHKSHAATLKALVDGSAKDKKSEEFVFALAACLMDAADISNEIRSFEVSKHWAPLVQEEFNVQGDAMKALGMPVPKSFDRSVAKIPSEQQGFIQGLCIPLFSVLVRVEAKFQGCVDALMVNCEKWAAEPLEAPTSTAAEPETTQPTAEPSAPSELPTAAEKESEPSAVPDTPPAPEASPAGGGGQGGNEVVATTDANAVQS